jgi:hypothetical protein
MSTTNIAHRVFIAVVLSATLGFGCAAPAPEDVSRHDDALTTYGDLWIMLDGDDLSRWFAVQSALERGFDRACGDTLCKSTYANLSTVRLACSSTEKSLELEDCAWVLGGSVEHVDARTGELTSEARVLTCKIPIGGTAKAMLDALGTAGEHAFFVPLPPAGKSFYDGLVDCLVGVSPPSPPSSDESCFAEIGDWAWERSSGLRTAWSETKRRLAENFDDICGDTFCEGEYADITPLGFACSVERATERVSRCTWTFAAADLSVGARGVISATTEAKRCIVEVDALASDLVSALSGPDPLYATLPGKTTSIYDALLGCL